ncbi:MAG: tail fiber domain-containing protein [Pontixanthobacter sp.]
MTELTVQFGSVPINIRLPESSLETARQVDRVKAIANDVESEAAAAKSAADEASLYASSALGFLNGVMFETPAAGISGTGDGDFFTVRGNDSYADLYLNASGNAVLQASYPSKAALDAAFAIQSGMLFTAMNAALIPNNVTRIDIAGYRRAGIGACQLFLWQPPMAELDPAGEGYWWTHSDNDTKKWFIPQAEGTPEMVGAFADDAQFGRNDAQHGSDDWEFLKAAIDYFHLVRLTGKYYSSKCLNIYRGSSIAGQFGTGAGNYSSRVRFARGNVGFLYHRFDTSADDSGKMPTIVSHGRGGADGFCLSTLEIVCGQGEYVPYDGANLTEHAVQTKCRGKIQHLRIFGPMGDGIRANNTSVSADPEQRGNSNGLIVHNVRVEDATGSPVHFAGADCNTGSTSGVNGYNCGGPTILEASLLGNQHDYPHASFCGRAGRVFYGGWRWYCLKPSLASDEVPGTGTAWHRGSAVSQADDWVQGKPYWYGGSYVVSGANSRCLFNNPYIEGKSGPFHIVDQPNTRVWIASGLLDADGIDVVGTYGRLSDEGIKLTGRDFITAPGLGASYGYGSMGTVAHLHNSGSINATRGAGLEFRVGYEADGTTPHSVGRIGAVANNGLNARGELRFELFDPASGQTQPVLASSATAFRPWTDNTVSLGTGPNRFSQIFAGSSAISTSDEDTKTHIGDVFEDILDAWGKVEWCRFKMRDAIALKGEDGARWHFGLVAQKIAAVFSDHGLDGQELGLLCYDEWPEIREPVFEETEEEETFIERGEVVDEVTGLTVVGMIETTRPISRTRDSGTTRVLQEAGSLWGVRYAEASALEAAWQRRESARTKIALAAMEDRISALEAAAATNA